MDTVSITSIVRASDDQISARLPDDAVVLGLTSGMYYGFSGIGGAIWELLKQPIRVADLRDRIIDAYEVGAEECEADLLRLLVEMAEKKLIVVVGNDELSQ